MKGGISALDIYDRLNEMYGDSKWMVLFGALWIVIAVVPVRVVPTDPDTGT